MEEKQEGEQEEKQRVFKVHEKENEEKRRIRRRRRRRKEERGGSKEEGKRGEGKGRGGEGRCQPPHRHGPIWRLIGEGVMRIPTSLLNLLTDVGRMIHQPIAPHPG